MLMLVYVGISLLHPQLLPEGASEMNVTEFHFIALSHSLIHSLFLSPRCM